MANRGTLKIGRIRRDGGTQPRSEIDTIVVNEYGEHLKSGAGFPPVTVFYDGTEYWLADGFHRVAAAVSIGWQVISADVRQGSRRDAVLYSAGANAAHGLRRTAADKRRAVTTLLSDPEWRKWSDREIARRCCVTHPVVASVRQELSGKIFQIDETSAVSTQDVRTVRRGKAEYQMRTAKRAPEEPAPPHPRLQAVPDPEIARMTVDIQEADSSRRWPVKAGSVNLIVTSPPYGLKKGYGVDGGGDVPAEDWPAFMAAWLAEAMRVAAPSGRLALNVPLDTSDPHPRPTYYDALGAALRAGWQYRWHVVWDKGDKGRDTGFGSVRAPHVVAKVEVVAVFHKPPAWPRKGEADLTMQELAVLHRGVWRLDPVRGYGGHPAAFPEELPGQLIKLLSGPGDTIVDPFLGSGTTAVAAWRLGRKAIGLEKQERWVDVSRQRLAEAEQEAAIERTDRERAI